MPKQRTIFSCQNCGAQSPRWLGRCPECGKWNTYAEEALEIEAKRASITEAKISSPIPLHEISGDDGQHIPTGIDEFDRVLGSGYIPGGVVLIGGDPGIGKSTIIMQALAKLASNDQNCLYISGEESASQIKLRADRMNISNSGFSVLTENCVEKILEQTKKNKPSVIVIDSIQTMYTNDLTSAPGSIGQVRESAGKILSHAKASGTAAFLIGHVTKDGAIAGPKVLEHMVDTVLYFEGERGHAFRILRTMKNRFGSTNEIGVFEMTGKGLKEVPNPSGIFLAEKPKAAAGSVVVASLEGSRPVLLEVQALVTSSGFGTPRRTSIGVDGNRVALLVAVLEKIEGLELKGQDIFLNVAGGIKINEPASDLGVIAAINSSFKNQPLDHETVVIGEVGLAGEIRAVMGIETRLKEAEKMGFKRAIVPKSNLKTKFPSKLEIFGAPNVEECLKML
ncbi:MAG: DNA repair protein RadA [Deltaproteobacteria bacterium]|jgi:DNA repair protein RadA/Sms|nr:DNA repair protein RadA [Deltaproteobacteria bacterium]